MFFLKKRMEISASHKLNLNYQSKCQNLHGHNWIIEVYCKAQNLDENSMIVDFTHIKKTVMELDHKNLNDYIKQPSAENIAKYIYSKIPNCYKVKVIESEGNEIEYVED